MIKYSNDMIKSQCSLILFGKDLNPEYVNNAIGVRCTESYKNGDKFSTDGKYRRSGMWKFQKHNTGNSVSDDIDFFYDLFPASFRPLTKIKGVESSRLIIWFDVKKCHSDIEISIDFDTISKIHDLGSQIYVTQLFPTNGS